MSARPASHCPTCGKPYRARSPVLAIATLLVIATAAILGGTALMLSTFGDELDRELDDQVDVVRTDFDRDVRRLERNIERALDERLP